MENTTKLRFGIDLPTRESVLFGSGDPEPLLAHAEVAEATGFDSVWGGKSLLARPRFDPLTLLSAVSMRTKRMTLGTAILLAAQRHPIHVAHADATLDQLSNGRLVLGIGAGAGNQSTSLCRALWKGDLSKTFRHGTGRPLNWPFNRHQNSPWGRHSGSATMTAIQGCHAGTIESTLNWLGGYIQAGTPMSYSDWPVGMDQSNLQLRTQFDRGCLRIDE